MPSETVPVLLAAMFTVGCITIHKAERYAEPLSDALTVLFVTGAALAIIAAVARMSGVSDVLAHSFHEPLKLGNPLPEAPQP
jgi:H+/gluconate symporter-like permease